MLLVEGVMMEERKTNKHLLKYLPAFIVMVIVFKFIFQDDGLMKIFNVMVPILLGVFLAMILNPVMKAFRKAVKFKLVAILLAYATFVSFLILVAFIITPQIARSVTSLIRDLPKIIAGIENFFQNPPEFLDFMEAEEIYAYYQSIIPEIVNRTTLLLNSLANRTLSSAINMVYALLNFIMAVIISAYILWDKESFKKLYQKVIYSFFEKETSDQIIKFGAELNQNVIRFIIGKIIDSTIIAFIAYVGIRYLIQAEYPLILALIINIANMIPYFGPLIGGVPAVIITLLIDPMKGLWMTIFILALQQFDGLVLGPKILGIQLNLKPVWIISAIIVGGGFYGVWGMFFATPIAALIKTTMSSYMEYKLRNEEFDFIKWDN
jgi:predicted PurR-regulated permease PerM